MDERDELILSVVNIVLSLQAIKYSFSLNTLRALVDLDENKLQQFYEDAKQYPEDEVYKKYNLTKPL